ncbi:MAG: hypothetical protein ACW99A_01155 [Candidatus Kariarchaeaceae archaeon]
MIQIAYTRNSDAIIAASIFGKSFYDLNKPCVIFQVDEESYYEKLTRRNEFPTIIIGMKLDIIKPKLKDFNFPILTINNEELTKSKSNNGHFVLNSYEFEYNNLESSLSACVYFVCSFLVDDLDYIVKLPLVAAQTKNLYSNYRGLHELILQDAISGKITENTMQLRLIGASVFTISEALIFSNSPYLPGLTSNEAGVSKLIAKSNIEIESTQQFRKLNELSKDEITDLNNQLIVYLSTQSNYQREDLIFIKECTTFVNENKNSINHSAWDFAVAINDAVNRNQIAIAMPVLMGNRSEYLMKLTKLFVEERKAPSLSYQLIEDKRSEIIELSCLRYYNSDRKINWYNVSITAALALSNGLVTTELPFAVISPGPDDLSTIAIRISKNVISESLSGIVEKVCEKLGIGASITGSGTDVQISVSKNDVDKILLQVNAHLMKVMS